MWKMHLPLPAHGFIYKVCLIPNLMVPKNLTLTSSADTHLRSLGRRAEGRTGHVQLGSSRVTSRGGAARGEKEVMHHSLSHIVPSDGACASHFIIVTNYLRKPA
jgi:hypothetical protein